MWKLALAPIIASLVVAPVTAQTRATTQLSSDQKGYIAYDQCMKYAAMRISHTDAKDEEVFRLAKAQCAATRAQVVVDQESNHQFLAALDAADADKSANFPAWIKGVRERRAAFEARAAIPAPIFHQ